VSLLFKLSQHEINKELMKSFIDYLNCGYITLKLNLKLNRLHGCYIL